jgi:AcrR family transcriptional regulator
MHGLSRREHILDTFDRLAEQYGASKVSVHELADEVGVSVGTLYNEFGNKRGLLQSASDRLQSSVLADPEEHMEKLRPEQELRALILGWIRALMDIGAGRRVFLFHSVAPSGRTLSARQFMAGRDAFRNRLAARIERVLERGVASGDFALLPKLPQETAVSQTAARIAEAFMEYWVPLAHTNREASTVLENADMLLQLLMRGLKSR